ncbi:glycoside hydrolase family 17 protein [Cucurbitaria berberidis CBS 394.84]|uniref:glucan 1,3-beta-glucosidase n=1 Tax=Cucurbitaria berberidis CBS 394.84 TaxID=1168544 RepID=A0A9P4G878_9PLEO|nr:glycoside hydrolase family 17 protein [Cucurbitaria berberidis CBS 394.84]KAF1840825.1 glycoside hydrolase family 17 protein [Cucurbitaria berberidis CBS 394.84]
MRFSTVAAALAASPALVSAAKGSQGFSLGTKLASGACKTQQDYADDFDAIKSNSGATIVRGYAASDCDMAKNSLPAAKSKGFKVVLGIWPDVEESFNKDLKAITDVAQEYASTIYAVTVGSETLYRGNFTGETLKEKINTVKSQLPSDIKVGTADSWNKFADGTGDALIGTADILLVNAFAFWQGASKDNATHVYLDDMFQAITHIEKVAGGADKAPEVWTGETGWPTAVGTDYGQAEGGLENAEHFYQNGFCSLLDYGFNAFYFEAFDEPWKPKSIGDNGKAADETTWGAMTADRKTKYSLKC